MGNQNVHYIMAFDNSKYMNAGFRKFMFWSSNKEDIFKKLVDTVKTNVTNNSRNISSLKLSILTFHE